MANTSDGREPQARVERTLPRGIETCGRFASYAKFLTNERSGLAVLLSCEEKQQARCQ
jgi:hypothetical protein